MVSRVDSHVLSLIRHSVDLVFYGSDSEGGCGAEVWLKHLGCSGCPERLIEDVRRVEIELVCDVLVERALELSSANSSVGLLQLELGDVVFTSLTCAFLLLLLRALELGQ